LECCGASRSFRTRSIDSSTLFKAVASPPHSKALRKKSNRALFAASLSARAVSFLPDAAFAARGAAFCAKRFGVLRRQPQLSNTLIDSNALFKAVAAPPQSKALRAKSNRTLYAASSSALRLFLDAVFPARGAAFPAKHAHRLERALQSGGCATAVQSASREI
jgi:hypothetical protein